MNVVSPKEPHPTVRATNVIPPMKSSLPRALTYRIASRPIRTRSRTPLFVGSLVVRIDVATATRRHHALLALALVGLFTPPMLILAVGLVDSPQRPSAIAWSMALGLPPLPLWYALASSDVARASTGRSSERPFRPGRTAPRPPTGPTT